MKVISILDRIAVAEGWRRPRTTPLVHGQEIPEDAVLKRTHSDCGFHVVLPEISVETQDAGAVNRRKELKSQRTWGHLDLRTTAPEQLWIAQEYVPTLRSLGEWRVFLVGGCPLNVVHTVQATEKGQTTCQGTRADRFLCLREIK